MAAEFVKQIENCKWYAIQKKRLPKLEQIMKLYGDLVEVKDQGDTWLISAESKAYPPASQEEIEAVEKLYESPLPEDYRKFLLTTNGADLFIHPQPWNAPIICECSIMSTQTLLGLHPKLFEIIKMLVGVTFDHLFYIPIAEDANGNYIALSTNSDFPNEIFQLYLNSGNLPYTAMNRGVGSHYPTIYAQSFSEWLERVLETYGAFGIDP